MFALKSASNCFKPNLTRFCAKCIANVGYTFTTLYAPYVTHLCMIVDLMPDSSQHDKCICNFPECCDNLACSDNCCDCFDIHQHLKCYNYYYRTLNSIKIPPKILFYPPNVIYLSIFILLRWLPLVSVLTHYFMRLLSNVVHRFKTIVR